MRIISQNIIEETVSALQKGKLVMFPSDTVYGLLVDATNEEAVKKLIAFKNRPIGKPISVFVSDFDMLRKTVSVNNTQKKILERLLPGTFTVILPSQHTVSRLLESEKQTLGVRIPRFVLVNKLVTSYGKPVTATSANISGRSPHYSVGSFLKNIPLSKQNLIDLIIDVGKIPRNKPSTIIDLSTGSVKLLRKGDIDLDTTLSFISNSETETASIATHIMATLSIATLQQGSKSMTLIIKGEMGAGKTVFVKAIGEHFGVKDIISPTFTIYYEYPLDNQPFKNLYHFDLFNIEDPEEFKHLGIEKIFSEKNIICIEWGEKSGEIFEFLQEHSRIVEVAIEYIGEVSRRIKINY